jgi:hypothetical protein
MTPVTAALLKMRGAGFSVHVVAGRLRVAPADRLTAVQRQWIAANRDALVVALANDDPHIGDFVETFDATVIRVDPDPTTPHPVSVDQTQTTDTGGGYPVWVTPVAAGTVRCADCGYGSRALPGDELGAWRLCEAGLGGRFALARHRCDGFKAG